MHALAAPVSGRRLLVAILAWPPAAGVVIVVSVVAIGLGAPGWGRAHVADLAAIALLEAYAVLVAVLVTVFGGRSALPILGVRPTNGANLRLAMFGWVGALVVGGALTFVVSPILTPRFGPARSNAVDVLKISFDPLFVALVVPTVCLLAPAAEELLFRGAIYGWLRRRVPVPAAVGLVGLTFALAHLAPPLLPVLFAFGVATCLVYEFTGSTLNSFAMHCAQNTLGVVSAYVVLAHGTGG